MQQGIGKHSNNNYIYEQTRVKLVIMKTLRCVTQCLFFSIEFLGSAVINFQKHFSVWWEIY